MSQFHNNFFKPSDFVGLYLALLMGVACLWHWAGRPPRKSERDDASGQSAGGNVSEESYRLTQR